MPDVPAVVRNVLPCRRIYGVGADAIRRDRGIRRRAQPSVAVESCPVRVSVGGRDKGGRRCRRRGKRKQEEDRADGEREPPKHGDRMRLATKYPLDPNAWNLS